MLLARVCALLAAREIPHALIGAAALASVGISRSTFDIDLLTTDAAVLRDAAWDPLRSEGVSVDVRRGDRDDPLAGVVRCEAPGERPVDLIVGRQAWQARAVERARPQADGPPVVLPRDLVLLKLYAGGSQDVWDVRELLRLPIGGTLIEDVEADLAGLPAEMRTRWAQVRKGL